MTKSNHGESAASSEIRRPHKLVDHVNSGDTHR
jgi:hypothetical protein